MRRVSAMTVLVVAGLSALLSLFSWIVPFALGTESSSFSDKAALLGFGETRPLDDRLTHVRSWPIVQQDAWRVGNFNFVRAFGSMSGGTGWAIESVGDVGWPVPWVTAKSYFVSDFFMARDVASSKIQFLLGLQAPLNVHGLAGLANLGFWLTLNCIAAVALLLLRSLFRLRRGLCPNCKYDVRSLSQCPECGILIRRGLFGMPTATRKIVHAQHH